MKQYSVTVRAMITKTLRVNAVNEDAAISVANERFSVLNDGIDESYEQDILDVEEAGEDK